MKNLGEIKNYYPINENLEGIDFEGYIEKVLNDYIFVENRKVVGDEYPFLLSLWYDYLLNFKDETCLDYLPRSVSDAIKYSARFQNNFMNVLYKLIPATSKVIGNGTAIRNTIFLRQKFKYKRGVDESSKFTYNQNLKTLKDKQILLSKKISLTKYTNINLKGLTRFDYNFTGEIATGLTLYDFEINARSVSLRWYFEDLSRFDSFEVQRIESGSCSDVDFTLITSNEIVTGNTLDNVEETKWSVIATDIPSNTPLYEDDSVLPNSSYLYRIRGYNNFGDSFSETLYVDILSDYIKENFIDNNFDTLENILIFRWQITSYSNPPPSGLFQTTTGYVAKLEDNLYYPITYNTISNTGELENTQKGYTQNNIVKNVACGTNVCPSIFEYDFLLENMDATIYIK